MVVDVVSKRLRSLRQQLGLTQEALGRAVGVARQTIASWEKGETSPTLAQLSLLAKTLSVSVEDLLDGSRTGEVAVLFRADDPTALAPELRAAVSRKVSNYAEVEQLVGEVPAVPPAYPMEVYEPTRVEEVAQEVRAWLQVDEGPIPDIAEWLETFGVKIILHKLPNSISGFAAFTEQWGACIVVNREHPGERQIFTLLHELGHLIFHRKEFHDPYKPVQGENDPREKTVNHFAAAVLLPASLLRRELAAWQDRWLPEPLLLNIKQRYRVSLRTILRRAGELGLISQDQAGRQIGVLNRKYGPKSEPGQLPPLKEPSRLQQLVFRALVDGQLTASRAAEILGTTVSHIRKEMEAWFENDLV